MSLDLLNKGERVEIIDNPTMIMRKQDKHYLGRKGIVLWCNDILCCIGFGNKRHGYFKQSQLQRVIENTK